MARRTMKTGRCVTVGMLRHSRVGEGEGATRRGQEGGRNGMVVGVAGGGIGGGGGGGSGGAVPVVCRKIPGGGVGRGGGGGGSILWVCGSRDDRLTARLPWLTAHPTAADPDNTREMDRK
ncbi:hypothetical protein E2C01_083682 [Portunus trituberculatus]|uniref:Uncharacterized protein n=1 Tax=Portunus trituberculatus TaxID=210409 RepID=A0A5B7IXT9_PORTR|nr:hypothetical protein [Portunus trituberculatus]